MLTITQNAAEAIKGIVQMSELPDEGGLRIAAQDPSVDSGPPSFELTLAPEPDDADEVLQEEGAQIFLEPKAASYLDDKVLDAQIETDRVNFTVLAQEA